jgi:hypothetical protein
VNLEVLIVGTPALPVFEPSLSVEALAAKDGALATSALIGKVTNRAENDAANNARKALREVSGALDRQRKKMTDPFVEAQRLLIRTVEPHIDELKQEDARLEMLVKDFTLAEQRRIREEQEAQRRELERIEAERQAELLRIAREQAAKEAELKRQQEEAERKERELREAAERAAREATTKKQREVAEAARIEAAKAAEAARIERERQQAELQAKAAAEAAAACQRAAEASRIESKPVEITRSVGQVVKKVWKITQINDFQLLKARPDLVRKIEWDMVQIKQLLADGVKLPGVTAEEDISVGARGRAQRTIDV